MNLRRYAWVSFASTSLVVVAVIGAPVAAQSEVAVDEGSCRTCHPGAVRALEHGAHRTLFGGGDAGGCRSCHGDLAAHAAAASRPTDAVVAIAAVTAASCAVCHPGRGLDPSRAAHPFAAVPVVPTAAPLPQQQDAKVLDQLAAAAASPAVRWSGLLDFGYRFVHVAGSRAGYATDVDLEPGARLRTAELTGRGAGPALFDDLSVRASDIGDPRWSVDGKLHETGLGSLSAGFRRDRARYDSAGDWHRVDRSSKQGRAGLEYELGGGTVLFVGFVHRDEDGFWLTERIGNRNVSVQSFVTGVESPRQWRGDDVELGLRGGNATWSWEVAATYRDEIESQRWRYSRPAPANTAFLESEDFTSRANLRGPGGRMQWNGDLEPLHLDLALRWFDHDRRVRADGDATGYDVSQFSTDTTAFGRGSARTFLADATAALDLADDLQIVVDARWRDHEETMTLAQTDVSTFPVLSTTVTVSTNVDERTAQRLVDGDAMLQWAASDALDLGVGYGYAEETLRVPDVDPSDPRNFRRGTVRDRGWLAQMRWQLVEHWTLRGDARMFGQDGVYLHELAPAEAQQESAQLSYAAEQRRGSLFVRHRRNENDVSLYRSDHVATGVTAGFDRGSIGLDVAYTFARTDSEALTNFYFDPDPNPVPTYVGFAGDTNTISGSLHAAPSSDVQWEFGTAYATTKGDFAVATLDWRADVHWFVAGKNGAIGSEYRQSFYKAEGGFDDWSAQSLFVYWRQVF